MESKMLFLLYFRLATLRAKTLNVVVPLRLAFARYLPVNAMLRHGCSGLRSSLRSCSGRA